MSDRLVALVDMDCFYCQVETRLNPSLQGKPLAVVQYNQWNGGGIIAVNYEARDRGVSRHMRGDEAKKNCPDIQLVSVPAVRGKADLTKYRDAGREVINVICEFSETVERASVDEAYVDLTEAVKKRLASETKVTAVQLENTFVVGYSSADNNNEDEREKGVKSWLENVYSSELVDPGLHRLAQAAALVEEMRAAVYNKTGFRCSAGISHNKILAKLVCGIHKPNRQTVLPMESLAELYRTLPVKKHLHVRNLGGKLGSDVVDSLGITHMAELANFSEKQLQAKYDDKTGTWLYNIARGVDLEPVTPRPVPKSIGCSKRFAGKLALGTKADVTHWLSEMAAEVAERLDDDTHTNKRKAQLLTVHFTQEVGGKDTSMSRSAPLPGYEAEKIANCAFNMLSTTTQHAHLWYPPLKYLGLSAGKFVDNSGYTSGSINKFFKPKPSEAGSTSSTIENDKPISKDKPISNDNKNESTDIKPKVEETQCSDDNQTTNKCNGRVSFFENYFKDQPNKIIRKSSPKKRVKAETITKDEKSQSSVPGSSKSLADNGSCSSKTTEDNKAERNKTWVSISEIFPDLDNIDEGLLNILPASMQRQVSLMRKERGKSSVVCKDQDKHISNNKFRMSTDADCAPTSIDTVADIHCSTVSKSVASDSSKFEAHKGLSKSNTKVEEDMIEGFIESSPDIFDSQTLEGRVLNECTECTQCHKSVLVSELQGHLDHHLAMQLQEQWHKESQQNTTVTSRTKPVQSDKKKRGSPSKKDNVAPKKSKTLLSFFSKA